MERKLKACHLITLLQKALQLNSKDINVAFSLEQI